MSVKIPILALHFETGSDVAFIQEFFQRYPDLTDKWPQITNPLIYSQIKSYYESPLQIVVSNPDDRFKVIASLNTNKKEVRLYKQKPRGSLIKKGRPCKKQQEEVVEVKEE